MRLIKSSMNTSSIYRNLFDNDTSGKHLFRCSLHVVGIFLIQKGSKLGISVEFGNIM